MIGVEPARIGDLSKIEGLIAQQRGSDATVRAITLTLVILAPDRDRREHAVAMLSEVGGSHPLRALVLTPDRDGPRAAVSLACWTGGDREVCSEQVVIEADAKALPSAAASLLAPDLPVFLWWQGGGDDGLLRRLAGPAVRLIMDSAECGLDAVRAARALGPAVSDLEWGRLQPWREALAGMFDGEDDREALRRASLLEVDGRESQARLLAGWLRSRLGLHIGLEHRTAAALTRAAIRAGGVYAVEAGGEDGIGRAADPRGEEHSVVLSDPPAAALLAAELGRLGADRIFEQALDAA